MGWGGVGWGGVGWGGVGCQKKKLLLSMKLHEINRGSQKNFLSLIITA